MRRALSIYQYVAPAVLGPLSFMLWQRTYAGDLKLVATAWLIPILWAYIVPGIGTNVLKVWEFDTRLRLGRFRPHHGFVFGSATAMLTWLVWSVAHNALILGTVIAVVNIVYDIHALKSGILRVYNQPWADGRNEREIALDYGPWFFGGFGAIYGGGIATMEWLAGRGLLLPSMFAIAFAAVLGLSLIVPTAGYMLQSKRRHGHFGLRRLAAAFESGGSPPHSKTK